MSYLKYFFIVVVCSASVGCSNSNKPQNEMTVGYKPDDQKLYDTIVKLDSIFFDYYNSCDVNFDKYAAFYSDSLEFYHDKGGFDNSKQNVLEGTKKYVCGKVTRELVKGSIEVYPIKGYGAVETGLHRFRNRGEKENTVSEPGKFIILWQQKNNEWKITRVISLH
jgi:hypothetical protein